MAKRNQTVTHFAAVIAVASPLVVTAASHAAYMLTNASPSITENFNSLPSSGTQSGFSSTAGVQIAVPGGTQFVGAKLSGTGSTAMPFIVDDGTSNSGALFSYGVAGSTERALGTLASGSNVPAFGAEFTNSGSTAIARLIITANSEQYRSSTTTQNVISAAYEVGAAGSTTFLTDAGATADANLNLVGAAAVATNGAITPTQTAIGDTISGLNILPGQSFYLRYQDTNDIGNDAGLALDDLSVSATFVSSPEPASLSLLAIAGVGLLARRRRGL